MFSLYEALFRKTEPFEEALQKDVSNFVRKDIEMMFIGFNSGATTSLSVYLSMLSTYTNWVCMNDMSADNINHYEEFSFKDLDQYVNQYIYDKRFLTREDVLEIIRDVPYVQDKFTVLGLFEGLGGENYCELTELKPEDINKNGRFNLVTGKNFYGSKELIHLAYESGETYLIPNEDGRDKVYKDIPNVIKPNFNTVYNDPIHKRNGIRRSVDRVRLWINNNTLSPVKLHKSGFVHYLKCLMEEEGMSFDEAFSLEHYKSEKMQDLLKRFEYDRSDKNNVKHIFAAAFKNNEK